MARPVLSPSMRSPIGWGGEGGAVRSRMRVEGRGQARVVHEVASGEAEACGEK